MKKNLISELKRVSHDNVPALYVRDVNEQFRPVMFSQLWKTVDNVAAALLALGVKKGTHVGIMSDNRPEWLYTDLAILSIGACDVPRGSDSTADEMYYILEHSDSELCFAENPVQCEKILQKPLPKLKHIILFDDYPKLSDRPKTKVSIRTFKELLGTGTEHKNLDDVKAAQEQCDEDDTATIIYTSGTTGRPKGVMLSHKNLLFEVERLQELSLVCPNEKVLAILPIWHIFERIANYLAPYCNAALVHSKPIAKNILQDMAAVKPQVMASVPRIWEGIRTAIYRNIAKEGGIKAALFRFFIGVALTSVKLSNTLRNKKPRFTKSPRVFDYFAFFPLIFLSPFKALGNILIFSKIKRRLGGKFRHGISGGASLAQNVSDFFQAVGIKIYEGYGMTETAPVIAVNSPVGGQIYGTVGFFLRDIQYKILDESNKPVLKPHMGTLHIKSDQVMQGYYKNPELTSTVLDKDGWLNTGDLVRECYQGAIKMVGRSKDTIVLISGENVEPEPIEEKLCSSWYIDNAVVLGNEQKFLGALLVPNEEQLVLLAKKLGIPYTSYAEFSQHPTVKESLNAIVQDLISSKNGFTPMQRITRIRVLGEPFVVGKEVSKTMKIMRHEVRKLYKQEIDALFARG